VEVVSARMDGWRYLAEERTAWLINRLRVALEGMGNWPKGLLDNRCLRPGAKSKPSQLNLADLT
jgi:hypothetical protein